MPAALLIESGQFQPLHHVEGFPLQTSSHSRCYLVPVMQQQCQLSQADRSSSPRCMTLRGTYGRPELLKGHMKHSPCSAASPGLIPSTVSRAESVSIPNARGGVMAKTGSVSAESARPVAVSYSRAVTGLANCGPSPSALRKEKHPAASAELVPLTGSAQIMRNKITCPDCCPVCGKCIGLHVFALSSNKVTCGAPRCQRLNHSALQWFRRNYHE